MAESTLSLSRSKIRSSVGFFLGWGRGLDFGQPDYTTDQSYTIDEIVASGLRRFYYPPQDSGFYDWSFLHIQGSVTIPASVQTVRLPDDFAGLENQITATTGPTTANVPWPLFTCSEATIRQMYAAQPNLTTRPSHVAVVPLRGTNATTGQRFELFVYPTPDQAYILGFSYTILGEDLILNNPYPYGGAQHSETILESCLAVAEERLDDQQTTHAATFARMLQASMAQDRRMKPENLGYNRDRSDELHSRFRDRQFNTVTIYGQHY